MFARNEDPAQFYKIYPAAAFLVIINVSVYLLISLPIFPASVIFKSMYGVNLYIVEGDYWRLISPVFLHGTFSHLVFNSISLIILAPFIERTLGSWRFLVIYLVSGAGGNAATYFAEPPTFTHTGASGAVFGLLGFYLAVICFKKDWLSSQNSRMLLTLSVIGITMTFLQPQINIWGHIGGLLSGFGLSSLLLLNKKSINE
ncbi:rhomboid family intramembrane serine protease [Peribacillus sp. SCS-26]|uniref:rhomboid family intramembrane serine protease n=1 Tax=Paraperibacillus marinus TaxID=3115295 RepID=UPI0039060730